MEKAHGLCCPQCGVTVEVEKELWIAHTRQLACRCKVCSVWWDFSTSEEGKVIDVTYVSEEV